MSIHPSPSQPPTSSACTIAPRGLGPCAYSARDRAGAREIRDVRSRTYRQTVRPVTSQPTLDLVEIDTKPSAVEPERLAANEVLAEWLGRVHCGDSVELLNAMPAESVDLFVTSPPYNIRNSTGNGLRDGRGGKWARAALLQGYAAHSDAMPYDEYVDWQRRALEAMMRLLKPTGAIFYNHKWRVQGGLLQDRSEIVRGFPVRQIIVWHRDGGINFNRGYFLPTYEVIYLICKPAFALAPKANALGDVWRIAQENNNPHPAPFPLELARRCIESTTGSVVCDPFMGSGTTAIAAELLGREWIGMDISAEYCGMAHDRIREARQHWNG